MLLAVTFQETHQPQFTIQKSPGGAVLSLTPQSQDSHCGSNPPLVASSVILHAAWSSVKPFNCDTVEYGNHGNHGDHCGFSQSLPSLGDNLHVVGKLIPIRISLTFYGICSNFLHITGIQKLHDKK